MNRSQNLDDRSSETSSCLFLPLALIDLIRRKRWERGSRRRSRGARTHLLPEPPNHSQRCWEGGGGRKKEAAPAWHRPEDALLPASYREEHICSEQNKERTVVVLGPRFSALETCSQPWLWSLTSQGGVWECAFLAGELAWLTWGPPFEKSNPTPSPKISEMRTSESFSKLETRPQRSSRQKSLIKWAGKVCSLPPGNELLSI